MRHVGAACSLAVAALTVGLAVTRADTIRFRNGAEIQGVVVKQTRTHVHVRYKSGLVIQYAKADIAEIVPAEDPSDQTRRLLREGRFDDAISALQKAAVAHTGPAAQEAIWFGLSSAWLAKGEYAEAAMRFLMLLREAPNTALYPYMPLPRATVKNEQALLASLDDAIGDVRAPALTRHAAKLLAAIVHIAAGRFDRAQPIWTAAQQHSDSRVVELATLVQVYALCRQRRWDPALELLEQAVRQQQPAMRPVLFFWLGHAAFERQAFERALVALLRVDMMYDPPPILRADALLLAGRCFEARRQFARALAVYDRLRQDSPGLQQAHEAQQRADALRDRRAITDD